MNNDSKREVKKEKQKDGDKIFISEVQLFNKPEGYEDAFKQYYPKEK